MNLHGTKGFLSHYIERWVIFDILVCTHYNILWYKVLQCEVRFVSNKCEGILSISRLNKKKENKCIGS